MGQPALVALGVLLIVGCAGAGAALAARSNHSGTYLVAVQAIPPGGTIAAADLASVALDPPAGLAAVPASDLQSVLGDQAEYEVPAGSLLDPGALTSGRPLLAGEAVVGTSLASNQLPDELAPGDDVLVVFTSSQQGTIAGPTGSTAPAAGKSGGKSGSSPGSSPGGGSGPAGAVGSAASGGAAGTTGTAAVGSVLTTAQVLDLVQPGSSASAASASNLIVVSLAVPQSAAALVAAASAADEISLALVPAAPKSGR